PMTQVALASGFASVRRFNDAFVSHYGLNPSALRRAGAKGGDRAHEAVEVRLGLRPPYDSAAMLDFFARRALRGIEVFEERGEQSSFARTLRIAHGGRTLAGWLHCRFEPERGQLM